MSLGIPRWRKPWERPCKRAWLSVPGSPPEACAPKAFLDERGRRAGAGSSSNPKSEIRHRKSEVREPQARASERLKRIDEVRDWQWRPQIEKELEALPPTQRAEWEETARQQLVARYPKAKSWEPEVLRDAIVPLLIEQFCQVKPEYEFGRWLSKKYPELAKELFMLLSQRPETMKHKHRLTD